jgi:hypothetical protein
MSTCYKGCRLADSYDKENKSYDCAKTGFCENVITEKSCNTCEYSNAKLNDEHCVGCYDSGNVGKKMFPKYTPKRD